MESFKVEDGVSEMEVSKQNNAWDEEEGGPE